jgi:hypothetical protein
VRQRRTAARRAGHGDYLTRPSGRRQLTPEGGQYAGSDTGRDGREGVRVVAKVSRPPATAGHRGRPRGGGGDWPWPAAFLKGEPPEAVSRGARVERARGESAGGGEPWGTGWKVKKPVAKRPVLGDKITGKV